MLIVLRHPDGVEAGAEYAKLVAENINGVTRIYNPRNIEDYVSALNGYKISLKKHLILLSTYEQLLPAGTAVEVQRQYEWALVSKAAVEYGVEPEVSSLSGWVGPLPNDPAMVAKNAYVSTKRAFEAKKYLGAGYIGRLTTDPHTVLVGYTPNPNTPNKVSGIMRQIVTSLPVEWGQNTDTSRASDWSGVAFLKIPTDPKRWDSVRAWLEDSSNFVAIGHRAHEALENVGIAHGTVPAPEGTGKFNGKFTTPSYGFLIRTVAKTNENRLEWKP